MANQYMKYMCLPGVSIVNGMCADCTTSCLAPTSANSTSLTASYTGGAAPTGQYRLIECSGNTSTNLICANCSQQCQVGFFVGGTLCTGAGTKDTTRCEPCTCPAGYYAPNNTCTGTTVRNVLQCIPCTSASSCPDGHYLYGTCSAFSNPVCIQCRPPCGAVELEVRACSKAANRQCLPNTRCFERCQAGTYETTACNPPSTMQECTPCSECPAGQFIKRPCTHESNTQCQPCLSAPFCADDASNAVFGVVGACNGSSTEDAATCGTITESYGQACSQNMYRLSGNQSRTALLQPWGAAQSLVPALGGSGHPALSDPRFNASIRAALPANNNTLNNNNPALWWNASQSYLAFDVHPERRVYAYCSGNAILTYRWLFISFL